jgi:hypothetical protein
MIKKSLLSLGLAMTSAFAAAQQTAQYEVTITNVSPGQTLTPQLLVSHPPDIRLFRLGQPASEELEILAEGGDTQPLTDAVDGVATDAVTIDGLLGPGESVSMMIEGIPGSDRLSMAAMLIPTNDTFVALNGVPLPESGGVGRTLTAYDAGTEENDQSCANIPGPRCGGEGYNDEGGEGFVHVGSGFHSLGDTDDDGAEVLGPVPYDWGNFVARVTVRRLN